MFEEDDLTSSIWRKDGTNKIPANTLRYYDELEYDEIARVLDSKVDTLKVNYVYHQFYIWALLVRTQKGVEVKYKNSYFAFINKKEEKKK